MTPRDRVLDLPELLECILGQLPLRDLLLVQRVCRTWQAIIKLKPLQRKLFFEEMPGGPLRFFQKSSESRPERIGRLDTISGIPDLSKYNHDVYHPQGGCLTQVSAVKGRIHQEPTKEMPCGMISHRYS